MANLPKPVDVHVGQRIKLRRLELEKSQIWLGDEIGVTFQQVQKYERGTNRVGASRLVQIARVLEVTPSYFFEGMADATAPTTQHPSMSDLLGTPEGMRVMKAFSHMQTAAARRRFAEIAESITALTQLESEAALPAATTTLPNRPNAQSGMN